MAPGCWLLCDDVDGAQFKNLLCRCLSFRPHDERPDQPTDSKSEQRKSPVEGICAEAMLEGGITVIRLFCACSAHVFKGHVLRIAIRWRGNRKVEGSGVPLNMAKKDSERVETSILPLKYVDAIEDIFHAVLAIALLIIGIGAFFFSIQRLIETAPFFPNGMIQGVNDILFIVIILEILRTVISRFTDGVYQLDKFLIIGVIAAVRHILTVGASLTLESGKSDEAFDRAIFEMGLNALIVVALVFAIFLSKNAHRDK